MMFLFVLNFNHLHLEDSSFKICDAEIGSPDLEAQVRAKIWQAAIWTGPLVMWISQRCEHRGNFLHEQEAESVPQTGHNPSKMPPENNRLVCSLP